MDILNFISHSNSEQGEATSYIILEDLRALFNVYKGEFLNTAED
jgi:hypothetical protein